MIYQELSDNQKKLVKRLFILLIVLVIVFAAVYTFYYGALGVDAWKSVRESEKFQISVSGEGTVYAVPDIAVLSVGVRSQEKTLKSAQNENTQKYNNVIAFLKENGVEAKDIKTRYYNVNPQYQYDNRPCPLIGGALYPCLPPEPPKIVGYEVSSTLEVRVRNLDSVGNILDGVVSAGANEVNGPSFSIDDENKLKEEAKKIAIERAKESAKKLSRDLGVLLIKITGFSESGGYPPIYYARTMEAFGKGGGDMPAPAPSIEPGQNEVKVTVSVTYEVR